MPAARSHRVALAALVAAWAGAVACGGNVVVDGASHSTGGTTTGTTGAGNVSGTGATTTGTSTGPQIPDGGSPECSMDYFGLVNSVESALGCTPWSNEPQCTGAVILHDPCGCAYVGNEAHPDAVMFAESAYMGCVADGCCGQQATIGCLPCPPPPVAGHCDGNTSRCVADP